MNVCFVCTGNICRSPMAAAVLTKLAEETRLASGEPLAERLVVTSAGTTDWHAGAGMDPRARVVLEARGYRDPGHVAGALDPSELGDLDLVVTMARHHRQTLLGLGRARGVPTERFVLLLAYDPLRGGGLDVPDPYYEDEAAFHLCLDLIERGCNGLVAALVDRVDGVGGEAAAVGDGSRGEVGPDRPRGAGTARIAGPGSDA